MSLEEVLRSYSHKTLIAIARFQGLESNLKKDLLVEMLAKALAPRERIEKSLSALDPLSREVLDRIALAAGQANTDLLEASLLEDGLIVSAKKARYSWRGRDAGDPNAKESRRFEDVLARLTAHGLVFSELPGQDGAAVRDFTPGQYLLIPEEVLKHIPTRRIVLGEIGEESLSKQDEIPFETLHRDSQLLASYFGNTEVALTKQAMVPKKHWKALAQSIFIEEDPKSISGEVGLGRPRFLRLALEEAGVLKEEEGRLICGHDVESFFKKERDERLRIIFESWAAGTWWNEADRIPDVHAYLSRKREYQIIPSLVDAREFVLGLVASLPSGKWVSFGGLLKAARAVKYDFLFPRKVQDYFRQNAYYYGGSSDSIYSLFGIYEETVGWQRIEGQFIANVIAGPLYWLGMVALGHRDGKLTAVKLTDAGCAVLQGKPIQKDRTLNRKIILQPNFQAFAFEPVDDYVLFVLDEFAERVKTGSALEYRLTRESVYRAQQKGRSVEDILAFLGEVVDGEIPQNVRRTLLEWGEQHERIVFRRGISLCHTASAELLDSLLADPDLAPLLGRRVWEKAAFVSNEKDSSAELANLLLSKGLIPLVTARDDGLATARVLDVEPNGRVRFSQGVPSIYVLRRLSPFTESREGERWLTRESVRAAVKSGMPLAEVISLLETYYGHKPPQRLLTQVRAWGGFFGKVGIDEVTLLKVSDGKILQELLDDPQIGKLMTPFMHSAGLAFVHKQDLETLLAAFDDLGIEVGHLIKAPR